MNVNITGRHFVVSDGLRQHIQARVEKLEHHFNRIVEAHVILSVEKFRTTAEVILSGRHLHIVCKETTGQMYSSIDKVMHIIEKRLTRFRDKVREHKARRYSKSTQKGQRLLNKIVGTGLLIEKQLPPSNLMTISDAIIQMETEAKDILAFKNKEDGKIHIVHKRDDGTYGMYEGSVN
ncbi:ribosomal subunit interface protein [bacterium Unc6]|nr:ribosomal subunit interface protein [bacterium Unc6]